MASFSSLLTEALSFSLSSLSLLFGKYKILLGLILSDKSGLLFELAAITSFGLILVDKSELLLN